MNKALFFLVSIALFSNCINKKDVETEIVALPTEILDNAVPIQADTLKIATDFPVANCYFMYNDSILIVQNYGKPDGYFLEFYNYKENRIVKQLLTQGKGPKEALAITPSPRFFGSKMVSGDIATQQLIILDIDSLLSGKDYEMQKHQIMYAGGLTFALFQDKLIAENPNCFKSEELGIELETNRFISCNHENTYRLNLPDCAYNAINVTNNGHILTNEEKGIVCYASFSKSLVEFYDKELNLTKKISGPKNNPIEYVVRNNNFIVFHGRIPYSYFTACSNNKYIYLLYVNTYWDQMKDAPNQGDYYIIKMDWEGNVVKTYKTNYLLHSLRCLTSEQTKQDILFGWITTDEGNACIIRLITE